MHTILRVEHQLGMTPSLQSLKQTLTVVGACRLFGKDGCRQLRGVADQDNRSDAKK